MNEKEGYKEERNINLKKFKLLMIIFPKESLRHVV